MSASAIREQPPRWQMSWKPRRICSATILKAAAGRTSQVSARPWCRATATCCLTALTPTRSLSASSRWCIRRDDGRIATRDGTLIRLGFAAAPSPAGGRREVAPSKQEVPLRHGQHVGRRAGQQHAVRHHRVGLGVDLEVRRGAVVHHAGLAQAAPRVLHGHQRFGHP